MRITPLSNALGAEVTRLDIDDLNDAVRNALGNAFLEHHLLCLRSAPLSASRFAAVARCFGTPQLQLIRNKRSGAAPEVSVLESTYKNPESKPDDLAQVRLSGWHTDDSYFAQPAKATMLQALEIPSSGGQTKFCNTRLAWEDLDAEMQARLSHLKAIHSYDTPRASARAERRSTEEQAETPDVEHPLIRTHDDSGRQSIYFNPNRTDRVLGMSRPQSEEILDFLYQHMTQPKYQYHHEWRTGDILLWDNRCLVHAVNTDYPVGETRRHQRILLEGPVPA